MLDDDTSPYDEDLGMPETIAGGRGTAAGGGAGSGSSSGAVINLRRGTGCVRAIGATWYDGSGVTRVGIGGYAESRPKPAGRSGRFDMQRGVMAHAQQHSRR